MKRNGWAVVVGSLGVLVGFAACSGKTAPLTDGGTADGGGGDDAGQVSAKCPAQVPVAASSCAETGLDCEYGTDIVLDCNVIAHCSDTGWSIAQPNRGTTCPTPPLAASCPATYAAVPKGAQCSTSAACTYPEGGCACEVYCGPQYPVGHECDAGTPMTWQCTGASQSGCPAVRPRLATPCAAEGLYCQYGNCDATAYKCEGSLWHSQWSTCPISTRRFKQDVHYLTEEERSAIAKETLRTRLATYEYTFGDSASHLGFIIEDSPTSPAVMTAANRVDLYAYTSMAVATLQVQNEEISALHRDVADLRRELDETRRALDARVRSCPSAPLR